LDSHTVRCVDLAVPMKGSTSSAGVSCGEAGVCCWGAGVGCGATVSASCGGTDFWAGAAMLAEKTISIDKNKPQRKRR
jgi:hypothetical protein